MPQNKDQLKFIHYEVCMFRKTYKYLNSSPNDAVNYIKNSVLESFLLHARNIIDFLSGDLANRFPDNITTTCFENYNNSLFNHKQITIINGRNIKQELHKRLSHISRDRDLHNDNWPIEKIYNNLNSEIRSFAQKLHEDYFPFKNPEGQEIQREDFGCPVTANAANDAIISTTSVTALTNINIENQ